MWYVVERRLVLDYEVLQIRMATRSVDELAQWFAQNRVNPRVLQQ